MSKEPCKKCEFYYPLQKVVANRKTKTATMIDLTRGYCLKRTVFAANKPGNPVYPPHAEVQDLPHNRAKVKLVLRDEVVPSCTLYKEKI